jgi:Domain of unknown function (DUF4331)
VQSIALQIPLPTLRRGGKASVPTHDRDAVIGVWATASRRDVRVRHTGPTHDTYVGPQAQVSRLGNPLFADALIPRPDRMRWNSLPPTEDKRFANLVERPELAALLPALHPADFPALQRLADAGTPRTDLIALLLTGIPDGLIEDFQNYTGDVQADLLRLNTAVPPAGEENPFGLLGGDLAGFPNGRRLGDDVVSIVLRAVAGVTVPMVADDFIPDRAAADVTPGHGRTDVSAALTDHFPYLGVPSDPTAKL